ncbi:hypothetical protein GOM49_06585 [Clostridium bovifaecis]|uniref:Uncharacterized protein n=1 Tax=Clostridium bovifaecis TaxID=2184719 RepID=A0A6I6F2Y0_9CLOT|nr:hypothetical protein GOM49_06585 [Clostridium bovifaecis]
MKLRGLHEFLDIYFNFGNALNSRIDKELYLSIRDALKVICRSVEKGNLEIIEEACGNEKTSRATIKLLKNFNKLMYAKYRNSFNRLQFCNIEIKISKGELNTNRRGIKIPFFCFIDNKTLEVIILAFSSLSSGSVAKEAEVLKGLLNEFDLDKSLPKEIKKITYWELNSCREISLDYNKVKAVSKASLVEAVSNI